MYIIFSAIYINHYKLYIDYRYSKYFFCGLIFTKMQDSGSFEEDSFRKKDVDCKPAVIVEISAKLSILRIPTSTLHYYI